MGEIDNKDLAALTTTASQHSTPVPRLPPELFPLILRNVSAPKRRTFYVCCLLSKQWHDVASPFLWSELVVRDCEDHEQLFRILRLRGKSALVRDLVVVPASSYSWGNYYFPFPSRVKRELLDCISNGGFQRVRMLNFAAAAFRLTAGDLSTIFVHCQHLIALDIDVVVDGSPTFEDLNEARVLREGFRKLKALQLSWGYDRVSNLAIESVGVCLESIRLRWKQSMDQHDVDRLICPIGKRCPNLRDFSLDRENSRGPPASIIPLLPKWDKLLRLSCFRCITTEMLESITQLCVNLKYLELYWHIKTSPTLPLAPLRILANGPFLYELSLVDVADIDEDDFEYWLQRRGKCLTLFSADPQGRPQENFSDKMFALLAQYAPNLRAAGFGYLHSPEGVLTLLRECAHLKTLSIVGNCNYGGNAIHDAWDDPSEHPEVEAARSRGVITRDSLALTPYKDLMKEKWIGLYGL
ncbi:hypothetical protein HK104_000456 [Borealophlyctis nickersoniae]|nr:hypothetical protein HK104_000456 [Borealophlyctis nickersoniae]